MHIKKFEYTKEWWKEFRIDCRMLVCALWHFHYKRNPILERIVHRTTINIIWTIFPSIILMFIAIPSFALLYSMDEVVDPTITIKVIGHQWYWSAPSHESDRSATKCTRLVLWSAKLLVYWKREQKHFCLTPKDSRDARSSCGALSTMKQEDSHSGMGDKIFAQVELTSQILTFLLTW
jgi:heme/copper-type cytochrome/quinol oxidase subunit 2